jgi:PadR family transcriptional regulator, regulatory protein PadR
MQNGYESQLLKGVLSAVLMRLLADQESYGFELVGRVQALGINLAEGTVYPALTRLEREGYLLSRLVASASGPARKYYRLSDAGRNELTTAVDAWRAITSALVPFFNRPKTPVLKEAKSNVRSTI